MKNKNKDDYFKETMIKVKNLFNINHIDTMKAELRGLVERIEKLDSFLAKEIEKPKLTTEAQRLRIAVQLNYMDNYRSILECRIEEKDKEEK